ncbi:hypothetical protein GW940_01125 [Candidatus Microgenomates bacterium]|nr:hypothetical protein [Candidatus Microgenomates bacterium]
MLLDLLIVVIAFVGNSAIGLVTYYKNPRSTTSRMFFLFAVSISFYLLFNYFALHQSSDAETFFWIKQVMTIALVINLFFFLLATTFPYARFPIQKVYVILLITMTVVLLPLVQMNLVFSGVEKNTTQPIPGIGMLLFVAHTVFFIGGAIFVLIRKYLKLSGRQKIQLKLFLLGAILMFMSILISNMLFVILFNNTQFVGLLPLYTLFFVSFVGYAIVKHRFLDIRLIVARSVAYSLLITILGGLYALGLFVVGNFITREPSSSVNLITSTLLALVMAFTFQPLRRRLERATDKLFYRDRYDVNHLLGKLGRLMASTYDLTGLSQGVLDQMESNLKATNATIVLVKGSRVDWSLTVGSNKSKLVANDIKKLIAAGPNKGSNVLVFDELDEGGVKEIMRKNEFSVVVPLIAERVVIGALILGDKASGDVYTSEDINVLEIIGPQISVAIDNARAYEEIKQFNIKLKKEIEEATSNLRGANKRLRDLDKIKDEFISITSHELRTPMTAVKSYLWMVLNKSGKNLGKKGTDHLNRAYVSTQRTINLVNDMLDVSRIEGNRFEINKEKIDIVELANESMHELIGRAHERKVRLTVQKKKMPFVFVDHDKIYQVMDNLISNALKFTPKGGSITVGFIKRGKFIVVDVRDTGTGISKSDQKRLFKKFGRVESSYTAMAEVGGTGLGLYVSKQIIEMHGGKIWIESEAGKGSTFLFTVPVAKV